MAHIYNVGSNGQIATAQVFQGRAFRVGLWGGGPRGERLLVSASPAVLVKITEVPPPGIDRREFNVVVEGGSAATLKALHPSGAAYAGLQLVVRPAESTPEGGANSLQELLLDLLQMALDLTGIIDPTPVSDSAGAVLSAARGDFAGAAMSAVGIIPFLGDLAKVGKLGRHLKTIKNAIKYAEREQKAAAAVKEALEAILKRIDGLPIDRLPKSAQESIQAMRKEIEAFLGVVPTKRKYNPNPKHEAPWAGGRKGTKLDLTPGEAEDLLNNPKACMQVPNKRQVIGVKDGRIYAFRDDAAGGFHAYPISGQEVTKQFSDVQQWVASQLKTDVKRLARIE